MKICFSTVTGFPALRWNFLGRFVCIAVAFSSTASLSLAGFQNGDVHASRGSFRGSVPRVGLNAPHGSIAAHNPRLNGDRGQTMVQPEHRGPMVVPNLETVRSRNGADPSNQVSTIKRQEAVPPTRDLNRSESTRPFGVHGQGPRRDSAEINARSGEVGVQHVSPNSAASGDDARINEKFQRYENKFASSPQVFDHRRERLDRTRAFLFNLLGLGYAPLTVDSWCDDLLDDRVDDGMPVDLVDSYWGQPVDTQEFVEYYVPYELYTYRTDDGNYHQVTYRNGVVSRPAPPM
jgi:hypothetical protein